MLATSDQRQGLVYGVARVNADVEQILPNPEQA